MPDFETPELNTQLCTWFLIECMTRVNIEHKVTPEVRWIGRDSSRHEFKELADEVKLEILDQGVFGQVQPRAARASLPTRP